MNWELEETPGYIVLTPKQKRLDSVLAPEFKAEITKLPLGVGKTVVLNLVNVEFMDSSGLGAVVVCYKYLQKTGGLYICNLGPQVRDIFCLTHMDRIMEVNYTFEDCVQKLVA